MRYTPSLIAASLALMAALPLAHAEDLTHEPFTDVPTTSANYKAIEYLREHNIIKGYDDGTFKPDRRINRAEFLRLSINPFFLDTLRTDTCLRSNVSTGATVIFFPDVPRDAWYGPELCVAKMNDIIDGYPDGKFRPDQNINFVEGVKIIANIFVANVKNDNDGAKWYRPYVQWVSDLHAIPNTITRLSQPITRGQMAEMMYRLHTDTKTSSYTTYGALQE